MKTRIPVFLMVLIALMGGVCPASELTSADTVIYRGDDGGAAFVPPVPVPDMDSGAGGGSASDADAPALAELVGRVDALLTVLCYAVGLFMWRLAVLSKSQRSIL